MQWVPARTHTDPSRQTHRPLLLGLQFLPLDGMDFSSSTEPNVLCHSQDVKLLSQAFSVRYLKVVLAAFRLNQCVPCVDEFEIAVLCHASSVILDVSQFTSEAEFPPGPVV